MFEKKPIGISPGPQRFAFFFATPALVPVFVRAQDKSPTSQVDPVD
jgi:hypothetical protein